ncbi:MAG: cell division protein FtsQ/DivIB [Methanosarcinaceae archaeon]
MLRISQKIKIDCGKKKYINPFFQKKNRIYVIFNKIFIKNKFIIFVSLFFIVITPLYLLFSDKFYIDNLEINGLIRVKEDKVKEIVEKSLNKKKYFFGSMKNIFLLDKEILSNDLYSEFYFEKIEINKNFLNSLSIEIQEKVYSVIWNEAGEYYYVDIDGYIVSKLNPLEVKDNVYPLIENLSNNLINSNKVSVEDIKKKINYILELDSKIKDINNLIKIEKKQDFKIEKYILDKNARTIKIKLLNCTELYFNTEQTQEKQINKLLIIINEKLKNDFCNKQYIDLRSGERVYYR